MSIETNLENNTALTPEVKTQIAVQVQAAQKQADARKKSALAIEITGTDEERGTMLVIAGDELRTLATTIKELDTRRKEITRPLDEAKSFVMDMFRAPITALEDGEAYLRGIVSTELARQRAAAAAAQRLQDEAAAAERKRLQEIEIARRAELDAAVESGNEQVAADAKAAVEEVAEERTRADTFSMPAVRSTPAPAGISTRGKWSVTEIDKAALVAAAVANPDLLRYLKVDEQALRQYATLMKAEARIPGVVFEIVDSLAVTRKF